jgi:integrase
MFLRGGRWYENVKGVDGKYKQVATGFAEHQHAEAAIFVEKLKEKVAAAVAAGATSGVLTVAGYSKPWLDKRERIGLDHKNDRQRMRDYVLPKIGHLALDAVRPRHLAELFLELRAKGHPAPRTLRTIYSIISALFRDAAIDGLIDQTPCILTEHQLGPIVDKDPEQREEAVFTRGEVQRLISDPRIDADRHMIYALGALAGLRHGESAGLRWYHYDAEKEPLGQLVIATSYDKGTTKTGVKRRVPVHPMLAAMLAAWRLGGWPAIFGRAPGPEDLIVPLPPDPPKKQARPNPRAGGMRTAKDTGKRWDTDLEHLELRHRRGHDLRATFITLAEDDGADPNVIRRITHTAKGRDAYSGYSRTQWETLCREVAKLSITRAPFGELVALPAVAGSGDGGASGPDRPELGAAMVHRLQLVGSVEEKWRSGRDLNPLLEASEALGTTGSQELTPPRDDGSRCTAPKFGAIGQGPEVQTEKGTNHPFSACDLGLAALRAECTEDGT